MDDIPNPTPVTFENNMLVVDGDQAFYITFVCNGSVIAINFTNSSWQWWKIGTEPNNSD